MFESTPITRRQATCATVLGALAVAVPRLASAAPADGKDPAIAELVAAHNKAFTAHDLPGVLACFTPKATLMGTAPGELWVGQEELSTAYKHMFADFDAGQQQFENLWREARVVGEVAWFMAVTKVTMSAKGKKREFGMNLSIVCERSADKWLINTMHFSNLVSAAKS